MCRSRQKRAQRAHGVVKGFASVGKVKTAGLMLRAVLKRRKSGEVGKVRLKREHLYARFAEEGDKFGESADSLTGGNVCTVCGGVLYVRVKHTVGK